MHDEEGPRRLRQGTDTPEALVRALTALRKGVDDSARLERVGQKMEAVMAAPPTAAEVPVAASRGLLNNRVSVLKLVVGGLGLLAPLFFFQFMDDATVPPSTHAGSPQPTAAHEILAPTATPATEAAEAVAEPAHGTAEVVSPSHEHETEAPAMHASRSAHAAATRARKLREPAAQASRDDSADAQRDANHTATKASTVTEATAAPASLPSATDPNKRKEAAQRETVAPDAAPRMSEAELLLKARQALKNDPALALRLASEHQSLFASGRLAPEREVLAIEALRNLGRKREADERLHKFEARYPNSIHLKRLHQF
jgi:hypothetical protein